MRLFGQAGDLPSWKAILIGNVCGSNLPIQLVDLEEKSQRDEIALLTEQRVEFPALQIDARSPVLVGAPSVMMYLARKKVDVNIDGVDSIASALIEDWLHWDDTVLSSCTIPLLASMYEDTQQLVRPEEVHSSLVALRDHLCRIEKALAESDGFLCEKMLTLADFSVFVSLYAFLAPESRSKFPVFDEFPMVQSWFEGLATNKFVEKSLKQAGIESIESLSRFAFVNRISRSLLTDRQYELRAIPSDKVFYVTTPIYYVNGEPHIGHVYTTLLADVISRWSRVRGFPTKFLTGTDEHGQKVAQSAESAGIEPIQFCDRVSEMFRSLFHEMNFSFDDFIRTTEERHRISVQELWRRVEANGFIYKGSYEGWYCISDETFYTELELEDRIREDGTTVKVSKASGHPVVWMTEENYMFRLSSFQEPLSNWLRSSSSSIMPKYRRQEIIRFVEEGLKDLSVSRTKKTVRWGIPVPDDEDHVLYVWMDALTNYLTASGWPADEAYDRIWPADYHIVGKDILRFHAVYWPAFLMAAGLPPPKSVVAHGWWTKDKMKISKSLGNAFDPREVVAEYGLDAFRYFLLRESSIESDGDYTDELMRAHLNADLADILGNLVCRVKSSKTNISLRVPPCGLLLPEEELLIQSVTRLIGFVDHCYLTSMDVRSALVEIIEHCSRVNKYLTDTAPWKLARKDDPESKERLNTILFVALESVRLLSVLLLPVMPTTATLILEHIGAKGNFSLEWGSIQVGQPISPENLILFEKQLDEETAQKRMLKGGKKKNHENSPSPSGSSST